MATASICVDTSIHSLILGQLITYTMDTKRVFHSCSIIATNLFTHRYLVTNYYWQSIERVPPRMSIGDDVPASDKGYCCDQCRYGTVTVKSIRINQHEGPSSSWSSQWMHLLSSENYDKLLLWLWGFGTPDQSKPILMLKWHPRMRRSILQDIMHRPILGSQLCHNMGLLWSGVWKLQSHRCIAPDYGW